MLPGTRTLSCNVFNSFVEVVVSWFHSLWLWLVVTVHGLLLNVVDRSPPLHLVQTGLTGVYSRPGVQVVHGLFKESIIGSLITSIFFCRGWSDLEKHLGDYCRMTCRLRWFGLIESRCTIPICLDEFNGMSSQSHISHCRVLSLGEFTVTIHDIDVIIVTHWRV